MATQGMEQFKAQLRFSSQKLGQLQAKGDSEATITRKDIATLLRQNNVTLARIKAKKLTHQDAFGDLLATVEMYLGVLLENTHDIQQSTTRSPLIVEAASTVIFSASYIQAKELDVICNLLIQYFGHDFTRSAMANRDCNVSPKVFYAARMPEPTATQLDNVLEVIAQEHGVLWVPEIPRHNLVGPLSEVLNPGVLQLDQQHLRKLCSRGIPDEPSWLRPRIWKILLGSEVGDQKLFPTMMNKQRETYYDLVETFLRPLIKQSDLNHASDITAADQTLIRVHDQLSGVYSHLFELLAEDPDGSYFSAMKDSETYHQALDLRWKALHESDSLNTSGPSIPEIRLEGEDSAILDDDASRLTPSIVYRFGNCHALNCSALMRLLYIHASINPGHFSSYLPSLLVSMYSAIMQEVEPEELLHAEADTFWLFEILIGEISELEDEAMQNVWLIRVSDRLSWADSELSEELSRVGLSPGLPHYSLEWLASLLSRTLPIDSILPIWDCIFCRSARTRDFNSKLDFLVNVCTAMLICIRDTLFRLVKSSDVHGLWNDSLAPLTPNERLRRDDTDAFLEGISTLRFYPVKFAGGVDRIIQTAFDLAERRGNPTMKPSEATLGERIKSTMWKGFTNQTPSPEESDQEEDVSSSTDSPMEDGNHTGTPTTTITTSFTSQIATTMWKGITNQTSMEPPVSPLSPITPEPEGTDKVEASITSAGANVSSSIWGYAEKLKDSDAVAALSKVSSNWRARGLTWGRLPATNESTTPSEQHISTPKGPELQRSAAGGTGSEHNLDGYSPPPRPAFFRPPRDSFINLNVDFSVAPSNDVGHVSSGGDNLLARTKSLLSKSRSPAVEKSIPRPLMLNSSTLITSPPDSTHARIHSITSSPEIHQWNDVLKMKSSGFHRNSRSSASSISPSDPSHHSTTKRRGWDSDTGNPSRVVPINRKSISPMAPNFRRHNPSSSRTSSVASSDRGLFSPPLSTSSLSGSDLRVPPSTSSPLNDTYLGVEKSSPKDSDSVVQERKASRKKTIESGSHVASDSYSSSTSQMSPSSRSRVKRYPPRLATLNIQSASPRLRHTVEQQRTPSPSTLTVDWPVADQESLSTPKAAGFEHDSSSPVSSTSPRSRRVRKVSTESRNLGRKGSQDTVDGRIRKLSSSGRSRKLSIEIRKGRESAAEEGDDEGYDELLSAYESEESWSNH